MAKRPKLSELEAGELLMFVSGYVYRLLRYEARQQGIRWNALMVLKDLDLFGPCTQRMLANLEQIQAPTLTVLVQRMEKRGWVRRASFAGDARVSLVTITGKGRSELRRAGRLLRIRMNEELQLVPAQVKADVSRSLAPLVAALMGVINARRTANAR
jgi:DNA-binding MarR family transcriptional regulator